MKKTAAEFLDEAAKTFRQRNAIYGNNFLNIGTVMSGLFPGGLTLNTPDEWNRLHILLLQTVKLSRYCNNWDTEGSEADEIRRDSMMDNTVYSAILESIDGMLAGRRVMTGWSFGIDHGSPVGDKSVLSVVELDGGGHGKVVFSTCSDCKTHIDCANKRTCVFPPFIPCASCMMQELCAAERHCDKTGNGYR